MSTYNYQCLPPGCIRILRLSPHEDDDAPIRCRLSEYSLASARRKGTHLYEALSYCWGSPTKSQTAFVDEGVLHITENLHAALLRLRDPALERNIWIDAICINQNNLDEKSQQVQLMAEIFAKASCVIVWLEYVTGDHLTDGESEAAGHQAIQALEVAAIRLMKASSDDDEEAPSENEQDRLAVEKLLGRPWFRRIWVLQEVAAARHVLIMCKSAEIDGQVFCSGLNQMSGSLLLTDEDSRSRIRSTVNLIKGATLRSKGIFSASRQFSLQISSLGYLIELHHVREATDRRDKIYALLGMSTDKPTDLVPNYQMPWKDLFPHLVKSLLPGSSSITTIDEHETALIKIRGCVIGKVDLAQNEDTWDGQQWVRVNPHKSDSPVRNKYQDSHVWTFQATSKLIHQGDFVCLLQGALLPTIVRAHQDYCAIVAIAVDTEDDMTPITRNWHNNTQFEFLMAWSLKAENYPSNLNEFLTERAMIPMSCNTLQIPDDLNIAVMLLETGQHYLAILKVHSIIITSADIDESQCSHTGAIAGILDSLQDALSKNRYSYEAFDTLRTLVGRKSEYVDVTEDILIQFASAPIWEPMAFVLDTQGESITITEKVLTAMIKSSRAGSSVLGLLLYRRKDEISVAEKCLKPWQKTTREGLMSYAMKIEEILLNHKSAQNSIPENVLTNGGGG